MGRLRPRVCKKCGGDFRGNSKRVYCSAECKGGGWTMLLPNIPAGLLKRDKAEYHRRYGKSRKEFLRQYIIEKKSVPCVDCGERYPSYVMDFDHVRGDKKFNLSKGKKTSVKTIDAELEKCDVVCSNCHRERTHGVRPEVS